MVRILCTPLPSGTFLGGPIAISKSSCKRFAGLGWPTALSTTKSSFTLETQVPRISSQVVNPLHDPVALWGLEICRLLAKHRVSGRFRAAERSPRRHENAAAPVAAGCGPGARCQRDNAQTSFTVRERLFHGSCNRRLERARERDVMFMIVRRRAGYSGPAGRQKKRP